MQSSISVYDQQDNTAFHLRFITIKANCYLISMGKLLKAIHSLYIFMFIHIKTTRSLLSLFVISKTMQPSIYVSLPLSQIATLYLWVYYKGNLYIFMFIHIRTARSLLSLFIISKTMHPSIYISLPLRQISPYIYG